MKRIFTFLAIITVILPVTAFARVDIIPRKIVMDSRDRSAEVTILNLFDQEGTFRIDIVYNRQNEDGSYTIVEEPLDDAFNADEIVRFSPRQFTLPSQGRQKIRLSLRKPADLPEGEYRFHVKALRFAGLDGGAVPEGATSGMSIAMKMNVGVTIPVIVKHGNPEPAFAVIKNPRLISANQDGRPEMSMVIERSGGQSTVGSLEAIWEPEGYDETDRIGFIDNMNVFTDISKRHVSLPLRYVPQGKGAIRLRYIDNASVKTKGQVIDEVVLEK